jgi:hypothetical protein
MPGTRDGTGAEILPTTGIVPIVKELASGQVAVVGTGFHLTRYGLIATARHVLDEIVDFATSTSTGFVFEDDGQSLLIRRIVGATRSEVADIALAQLQPGLNREPNKYVRCTLECPTVGERLVTFAYPENRLLDFTGEERSAILKCDYFEGVFQRQVAPSESPFMPYPHYETTIEVRSGASGCPMFNKSGRVVAIACRGWDFRGGEHEGNNLSAVIPLSYFLSLNSCCAIPPEGSWEYTRIPEVCRNMPLSFGQLIAFQQVDFGVFRY